MAMMLFLELMVAHDLIAKLALKRAGAFCVEMFVATFFFELFITTLKGALNRNLDALIL